jgi:electron transport complex protein RnfG
MNPRSPNHALILGTFCLGFAILLALTNLLTADAIAARALEDRLASLAQVIPASLYDNNPVADAFIIKDPQGKETLVYRATRGGRVAALAYETAGSGYSGEIRLMLGVDPQGRLLGVRVTSHKETPGLGDKIEEKKGDWILRFAGLSLGEPAIEKWKVKKDGGQFDSFAGATITPRAVVGAVRRGLEFFAIHRERMLEKQP